MSDLVIAKNYKKGSRGKKVRLIQEWLCLHDFNLSIDGDFGPATDFSVRQFQEREDLTVDGIVGQNTFTKLIFPMTDSLSSIPTDDKSVGQMVVSFAKQHLQHHPREIGGQNKGPRFDSI